MPTLQRPAPRNLPAPIRRPRGSGILKAAAVIAALMVTVAPAPAEEPMTSRQPTGGTGCSGVGMIWWNELLTLEPEKLSDFYAGVVGWSTKVVDVEDQAQPPSSQANRYTIFLKGTQEVAGLMRSDNPSAIHNSPGWFIYFQVENLEAALAKAEATGGTILRQPTSISDGNRVALLKDPAGNVFGLVTTPNGPSC